MLNLNTFSHIKNISQTATLSLHCLTKMRSCSKLRPFAVSARKAGGFSDLLLKFNVLLCSRFLSYFFYMANYNSCKGEIKWHFFKKIKNLFQIKTIL